jgi:cation/acetate symporter
MAGWIAMFVPADPLDLMLWGLAISASASFPVLVLSVWWKRLNAFGALVGMTVGFWVAVLAILAGESAWLGLPGELAAVFGVPAGFAGALIAARAAPSPDRRVLTLVRDMRLPGGETMEDRETRLQRLKNRRGP